MTTTTAVQKGYSSAPNGYTAVGQNQPGGGSDALDIASRSVDKGGMRGLGLLAVTLAEIKLKRDSIRVAESYYDINRRDYEFFRQTHQPAMAATASEVFNPAVNPTYQYDQYAYAAAGIARSSVVDKQWFETRRRMHRYAVGAQNKVDYEFALLRTHGVVSGWNLGIRLDLTWTDEHNNRAFDRKVAIANAGIGVGTMVSAGMASAATSLAAAYDSLGDTVATIGNGLAARRGIDEGTAMAAKRYDKMRAAKGSKE